MVAGPGSLPKSRFPAGLPRFSKTGLLTETKQMEAEQTGVQAVKWVSCEAARLALIAAEMCDRLEPPELLAEWAEGCQLLARANPLIVGGKPNYGGLIELDHWRAAREQGGIKYYSGEFDCDLEALFGHVPVRVRTRGVQVDYGALEHLIRLKPEESRRRIESLTTNTRGSALLTALRCCRPLELWGISRLERALPSAIEGLALISFRASRGSLHIMQGTLTLR